jgi:sec-independent protein translocase protein TatA
MGIGSWWHWVIVALVVLILFGRGKISETMGDFGKGIRSFKKGLGEEDESARQTPPAAPPPQIAPPPSPAPEQPAPAPAPTESNSKPE